MAYNFVPCDRDQPFLMPPSLDDWLPKDHLARFVVAVVETLDLAAFYARRRADGWGRAAYDPKMMVALLIYAYATGARSSRLIERRCVEDIAFRFIAANEAPDHATIARFVRDHEREISDLFDQVLRLAADVGLVRVGLQRPGGRHQGPDHDRLRGHHRGERLRAVEADGGAGGRERGQDRSSWGIGVVADAGYLSEDNLAAEDNLGIELVIATKGRKRAAAVHGPRPRGRIRDLSAPLPGARGSVQLGPLSTTSG